MATGFLWFLAFLFSTTVHEAMHALVALRGGDPTAYHGGQVSLSPIPHIRREPIGMLVVPLLTALTQGWAIGWASTPYDTRWAARYPKRAALMAAAGPAGNLSIAFVALVLIKIGLASGWLQLRRPASRERPARSQPLTRVRTSKFQARESPAVSQKTSRVARCLRAAAMLQRR